MASLFQFTGIWVPLVTPLDANGAPDHAALATVIDRLVSAGVQGLISGGSTGENYAQTVEERIALARFTKDHLAGRVPLVMGVGAMLTADSLALARAAREMGADGILLASPAYALPTDAENAANALEIDRAADLPVMLYNYPGRTGAMMGEAFLRRVTDASANFCAIKESSGDIERLHMLACDFPQIQLGCGMDDQALEYFAWGAPFWVCGGANFLPGEHLALFEACILEGDFDKGRRIMAAMMPLMRVLEQGGKFIQTIKHGVTLAGTPCDAVRPPLLPLEEADKAALVEVVDSLRARVAEIRAEV